MLFFGRGFRKLPIERANAIGINKSLLHGRGVFADKNFRPGEIIEISPVILFSQEEKELLRHTLLFGYYFVAEHPQWAIAMGLGASSMFNHSYAANAEYSIAIEHQAITIRACKIIQQGEEITLNYNGRPDDRTPVYFPPAGTEFADCPDFTDSDRHTNQLYLKIIQGKGRGVYCKKTIKSGTLIESSHLLVLPSEDYPLISNTRLIDYIFHFDREMQLTALALGFGSLYNHALYPNAGYDIDHAKRLIRYYALEDIPGGNEICINYDGCPGSDQWFKARAFPECLDSTRL